MVAQDIKAISSGGKKRGLRSLVRQIAEGSAIPQVLQKSGRCRAAAVRVGAGYFARTILVTACSPGFATGSLPAISRLKR